MRLSQFVLAVIPFVGLVAHAAPILEKRPAIAHYLVEPEGASEISDKALDRRSELWKRPATAHYLVEPEEAPEISDDALHERSELWKRPATAHYLVEPQEADESSEETSKS